MFLGRSTQQWLGLISAGVGFAQIIVATMLPDLDQAKVAVVLGAVGTFLGVLIAFVANTYTTPTADPQLKAGTMVRVTDDAGTVTGHMPVPTPK